MIIQTRKGYDRKLEEAPNRDIRGGVSLVHRLLVIANEEARHKLAIEQRSEDRY